MKRIVRAIVAILVWLVAIIVVFFGVGAFAGAFLYLAMDTDKPVAAILAVCICEIVWLLVVILIFG